MNNEQQKLIKLAKDLVNTPYKYGAKMSEAPKAFDCSSFIKYIYSLIGETIPRSTIEQAEFAGKEIKDINKIEPGDLFFLKGSAGHYNEKFPNGVGHVIMYVGGNEVIHAKSQRIQHYPLKIKEKGQVVISLLDETLKNNKPIVIIKRII